MYKRFTSVLFAMLTACATGGIIAISSIFIYKYLDNNPISSVLATVLDRNSIDDMSDTTILEEDSDNDPSFISRFTNVFIYSADDSREIIESAKNSLPSTKNTIATAKSYAVTDMGRDVIVLEKESDTLMPIASVTKLVTAVIVKRLMNENDFVNINQNSLRTYGNEARLRDGEKLRVEELLYPLLMVSSNDSAEALAQAYGRKKFVAEMNAWANSIGAYRTYFRDPSGLSSQNVSTAHDLYVITKWIYENMPEIFDITLLKEKTIRVHTWINPTHFLNLTAYAGGKNGYTPEALKTGISLFKLGKQERLYAVILLGSVARDADILDLLEDAVR